MASLGYILYFEHLMNTAFLLLLWHHSKKMNASIRKKQETGFIRDKEAKSFKIHES